MNAKIISEMINKKVIVCFLGIFVLSAVDGQRRWQYNEDDALSDSRSLRHHQHQQQLNHHQIEDVTQGADSAEVPYSQTVNLRHHNRHHQHRRYTSRTTNKPTTTTTTEEPVTPNPEEHRLRHSNKLYQPYAMVELKERLPQRRRSNISTIPPLKWERPIPPQHHRQSTSVTKKPQNLFNVSTVMKNRYFDRDGLYTIRHTTTTTPPPPARIRHPYDILKIPYKDRIRQLKKSTYNDLSWEDDDDDNSEWDKNDFDSGDEMDDEDVSSWNRQGRSKKTTKQLKSTGRKLNIDSEEFDVDEFDENDDDDDNDNVDDVYSNRRMRNQHNRDNKVSFQLILLLLRTCCSFLLKISV